MDSYEAKKHYKLRRFWRHVFQFKAMVVIAAILVFSSVWIAVKVDEPGIAPWGLWAGLAVFGVALTHPLRRLLFPYIDLEKIHNRANDTPTGAGLVFLGVCIVIAAVLLTIGKAVKADELPANAVRHLPVLKAEQQRYWPDMFMPAALAAQVEQETCLSLRHSRCWSPAIRNVNPKNRNELGVGLGQITRTSRFDALSELVSSYPRELAGWSWDSPRLYNPVLQLRGLVLKDRQEWRRIIGASSDLDRLAFTLAAYNGGGGGVASDRRVCRASRGCDPSRWFGHVEHASLKPRTGGNGYAKSFFEINREYVRNILLIRQARYRDAMA